MPSFNCIYVTLSNQFKLIYEQEKKRLYNKSCYKQKSFVTTSQFLFIVKLTSLIITLARKVAVLLSKQFFRCAFEAVLWVSKRRYLLFSCKIPTKNTKLKFLVIAGALYANVVIKGNVYFLSFFRPFVLKKRFTIIFTISISVIINHDINNRTCKKRFRLQTKKFTLKILHLIENSFADFFQHWPKWRLVSRERERERCLSSTYGSLWIRF